MSMMTQREIDEIKREALQIVAKMIARGWGRRASPASEAEIKLAHARANQGLTQPKRHPTLGGCVGTRRMHKWEHRKPFACVHCGKLPTAAMVEKFAWLKTKRSKGDK